MMRTWRAWVRRLVGLVGRARVEREVDAELDAHLQLHIDDNRRLGMTPEQARRDALLKLGGLESARERYRERHTVPLFENIVRDLRYALRSLRRSPSFTCVAAATLALGIGGATTIFAVVYSVVLRPLPFRDASRLVMIWERPPQSSRHNVTSMQNYVAWRERTQSFEAIAAFEQFPINLIGSDEAVQVTGARVTADFFRLLGVDPVLGRGFASDEDAPGARPVMVLSHGFWLRRFAGRADALGQRISVNGSHHQIIGVMPAGFSFPDQLVEVFVPLRVSPADGRSYSVLARLWGHVGLRAARDEMVAVAARLAEEHPESNADWSTTVVPLHEQIVGDVRRPILVLFAAVGFVLLIACANVANLLSMRSVARVREMDVRLALGAGHWRLLQQVAIESLMLAAIGAAVGVGLAWAAVRALIGFAPAALRVPRLHEISMDPWILAFAAGASIAAACLFGIAPAVRHRRGPSASELRASSRSVTCTHRRSQSAIVIAQVALALPLLVGAGLMVRSIIRLNQVDPGFRAEGVLTVRMLLLPVRDRALHAQFVDEALERVRAVPGVVAAGSIARLPMDGANTGSWYYRADRPEPAPANRPGGDISIVTPGYFGAMGIPLRQGREFTGRDRIGSPHVAMLNETAARTFFGGEDPLGKRLKVWWNDAGEVEIIGIAGDIRHRQLQTKPAPCLFLPNAQQPFPFSALVIRTAGEPAALAEAVRAEIHRLDSDQGVGTIQTMKQIVSGVTAQPRLQTLLFGLFGLVALTLTSIGLYGVLAYSVAQRAREIGLRVALGATPGAAFSSVLRDGLRLTAVGLAIGCAAAVPLTRFMQGLLFEVEPLDPVAFVSVIALLTGVAAVACAIPASRAAWIDPASVLRQE